MAIYPGTFDPLTNGHVALIQRASCLFDKLIIAVAKDSSKSSLFSLEQRIEMAKGVLSDIKNVEVDSFDGLLVEYCQQQGANVILRGLRNSTDFEYESQLANMNRQLVNDIETLFLDSSKENSFISSSLVKEVAKLKGDVKALVPTIVLAALDKEYN